MRPILHLLSALLVLAVPDRAADLPEPPPPLRPEQARALVHGDVAVSGWVTYVCPLDHLLGLQDGAQGVFYKVAEPAGWLRDLDLGAWVTVTGRVGRLDGLPLLRGGGLRPSSPPAPQAPEPFIADFHDLLSGHHAGCRVRVRAMVRVVRRQAVEGDTRWVLELAEANHRLGAWLCEYDEDVPPLHTGDLVQLDAVSSPHMMENGRLLDVRLMIPYPASWRVLRPAEERPEDLPLVPVSSLHQVPPAHEIGARLRVRGVIAHVVPGVCAWLQSDGHPLELKRLASHPPLKPGDEVEASGFYSFHPEVLALEDCSVRKIGEVPEPRAIPLAPGPGTGSRFDDQLVSIHARVVSSSVSDGIRLVLATDDTFFPASGRFDADAIPTGALERDAVVRVSGILEEVSTEDAPGLPHSESGFLLLLRRPSDVALVTRAPFWTPELLARLALAGLCLLLGSLAWVRSLRVRVDQRTRQLARETQQRRHEEVEFAAVLSERKRLAAELHDTLEQSLTGVSLQLQAADLARASGTEPQPHLELASRLLARSREEIRRSVWDLRSETLDSRDLHAAVQALAREGAGGPAVTVEVRGRPEPLPDLIANHLLRVVQEAVRNADKNGRATAVRISLRYLADAVEVEVADNGCGFDPATAPGPESGHFGLQGIRERAARLGGKAEIRGAPGGGAVVFARVPWSPRDTRAGAAAPA